MKRMLIRLLRCLPFAASFLTLWTAAGAAELSGPFVVNAFRQGGQDLFGVASGANGDAVLLWQDTARGGYMFIQRFDGDGVPLQSDDWYVGAGVESVVLDKQGNFATAAIGPDGSGKGVFVTIYNHDGSLKVPRFRANATAEAGFTGLRMAANANGQLAVAWSATRASPAASAVLFARTFSASGVATSPEVFLNGAVTPLAVQGVAMDGDGNFGVAWLMKSANGTIDTYFRRVSNSGSPQTGVVMANTYTTSTQANCAIAMSSSGHTVVIWESYGQEGSTAGVYGQRFDGAGSKVGSEFRINETTAGAQSGASVGMAGDGSFLVSWYSDTGAILMRQYRPDGSPVAGAQVVYAAAVSTVGQFTWLGVDPAGIATVGWRLYPSSGDRDVYARRYVLDTQPAVENLTSGRAVAGLSGAEGSWRYFKITVPQGKPTLTVTLSGPGVGNANLYGKLGSPPTLTSAEVASTVVGNSEGIVINNVPAGTWYFGLFGASAYGDVTLSATY